MPPALARRMPLPCHYLTARSVHWSVLDAAVVPPFLPAWRPTLYGSQHKEQQMSDSQELSPPVASEPARQVCQGPVMPIGGAEEKSPGSDVLERFIELAGGERARIAIVPTAS